MTLAEVLENRELLILVGASCGSLYSIVETHKKETIARIIIEFLVGVTGGVILAKWIGGETAPLTALVGGFSGTLALTIYKSFFKTWFPKFLGKKMGGDNDTTK